MKTARIRAHRIFADLTRDLALASADFSDKILCPLCLTPMPEGSIDLEDPLVTEEHIIPQNLGGTLTTLTCKRCNNTHGSALESHLIQMLRSHDSLSGVGSQTIRGWIDICGKRLPVDVDLKAPAKGPISFIGRPFDPSVVAEVSSSFRNGLVDSIGVTVTAGYVPVRANLGLLRIAYLAMFHRAGYRYILSPAAGVVRQVIARFEDPPTEIRYPLVAEVRGVSPVPSKPLEIYRAENGKAYLVLMTLAAETERYYVVAVPDPKLHPEEVLRVLLETGETVVARRKMAAPRAIVE